MESTPGRTALVKALHSWKRHVSALVIIFLAFGIARYTNSSMGYYGAALIAFAVWMVWFVETVVAWIRLADF